MLTNQNIEFDPITIARIFETRGGNHSQSVSEVQIDAGGDVSSL